MLSVLLSLTSSRKQHSNQLFGNFRAVPQAKDPFGVSVFVYFEFENLKTSIIHYYL